MMLKIKNLKTFESVEAYYEDTEYISQSMIKDYIECPYYYKLKHIDKTWPEERKDYFDFGQGVDTIMTEGMDAFKKKFKLVSTRSKKVKEEAEASGQILLTQSMYDGIMGCMKELERQPLYHKYEFSIDKCQAILTTKINGYKVKGRLDYLDLERRILADQKTTADLARFDPRMYTEQMGWYHELAKLCTDGNPFETHIIAEDKTDRHRSRFYVISESTLLGGWFDILAKFTELTEFLDGGAKLLDKLEDDMASSHFRALCEKGFHDCPAYSTCPYTIQTEHFII